MQLLRSAFHFAALLAATSQPSLATDTPTTSMAMPKWAVADQVVMVDPALKAYTLSELSSNAQSRREKADAEAKTNVTRLKTVRNR